MEIGFIGLGKMGFNLVLNLSEKGHNVVAYNRSALPVTEIAKHGIQTAKTIEELVSKLDPPRIIWIMVPEGDPVKQIIAKILPLLTQGDTLIDGGNSFYKDSIERYNCLKKRGIHFLDVGTSGGIVGARRGACLMVGGDENIFKKYKHIFKDVSVQNGYAYIGKSGAGHFIKMVHNGIEYGFMQALGEGFELIEKSCFNIDPKTVAKVWANGSVIRSWLMDLMQEAFAKDICLSEFKGPICDSGEGRWTIDAGLEYNVPLHAISAAVWERYRSRNPHPLSHRVISALREGFGRHVSGKKL